MFSDSNLIFVTLWPTVLFALSVVAVIVEYLFFKKRAWFSLVSAIIITGSAILLLKAGCALCDFLLLICGTLAIRLFFEILDRRKKQ